MNEFVEECRREWRRLGVPDPIAREMAADLEADLEEARADGVAPEEVLGRGAFDPRSFAAAWASERGVSRPGRAGSRLSGASLLVAALAAFVAVTIRAQERPEARVRRRGRPDAARRRPLRDGAPGVVLALVRPGSWLAPAVRRAPAERLRLLGRRAQALPALWSCA